MQRCSPPSLVLSLSPGLGPDGLPSPGGGGASGGHYPSANGNSNRSSPFSSSEQVCYLHGQVTIWNRDNILFDLVPTILAVSEPLLQLSTAQTG